MAASPKLFLALAAAYGAIAVALGAFGAHGLKGVLGERMLAVWQTAVNYQFYHSLALLLTGVLLLQGLHAKWLGASAYLFAVGVLFFSGSLYWLALGGPAWLGPITPLGGLAFIAGWACLLLAVLNS